MKTKFKEIIKMKTLRGRTFFSYLVAVSLLVVFLSSAGILADMIEDEQIPPLLPEGELTITEHAAVDYQIPDDVAGGVIHFELRGADGGHRYYKGPLGINSKYAQGGGGATLTGMVRIGHGGDIIEPGTLIRFVTGAKGDSLESGLLKGAGGGGGTAVLVQRPGSEWVELLVAAGGGGAAADSNQKRNGGNGMSDTCTRSTGGSAKSAGGGGGADTDGGDSEVISILARGAARDIQAAVPAARRRELAVALAMAAAVAQMV